MKKYQSAMPYPFSRAIEANGFLFLSGQLSMNSQGEPIKGSIVEQTDIIMKNIQETLTHCGSSLSKVVKVTVWLSDMRHFELFNETYKTYFTEGFPVRTTVTSKLAFNLDVEIEVQALA